VISFLVSVVVTGAQLACAQALWKHGVEEHSFALNRQFLLTSRFLSFAASPFVWGGAILYVIATGFYMSLLARHPYAVVQGSVIALVLIFSFLLAHFVFHEPATFSRLAGLALLMGGVVLISR